MNNIKHIKNGNIEYLEFTKLNELKVNNCFTLKPLNFSFKYQDNKITLENFKTICNIKKFNFQKITRPIQNHTDKIAIIKNKYGLNPSFLNDVDSLVTNQKDTPLAITSADCNVITLYDPIKNVIALIHSGWKGTLNDITIKTLDVLINHFKANSKDVLVFFSPSICHKCFEVENDVYLLFKDKCHSFPNINEIIKKKNSTKYLIDTITLIETQLINKGIKKANIYKSDICTLENNNTIHSYRASSKNKYGLNVTIVSL